MQAMKIVYHYVLPLLILAISVSYLQSNNQVPDENILGTDGISAVDDVKKESANRESILPPAERALTTIVQDQRDSRYSADEADLADMDGSEESIEANEAVGETQIEGFMAMYMEESEEAPENSEELFSEVETHEASDSNRSDIALNKLNVKPSSGQVINIEISGNQLTTSQSGITVREVYGTSPDVNGAVNSANTDSANIDTVNIDTGAQQNSDTSQNMDVANDETYQDVVDTMQQQDTVKLNCPKTLYMGGNAYAVSMLKKRGCPKPTNYQGAW